MNNDMSVGLIRQRRNFLLNSLFIAAYELLDIKIKNISLLGTKIEIESPEHVLTIISLFWIYFLWRFYQYSRKVDDFGIKNSFKQYLEVHSMNVIGNEVKRQMPRVINPYHIYIKEFFQISFWKLRYKGIQTMRNQDENKYAANEQSLTGSLTGHPV